MELSLELNLLPRHLSANLPDMRQDTPSTQTLVHSQAELLESLASLLHHIRHERLEPRTHSFEFSKNPRQRLSLHFETLGAYLGFYLEGFESLDLLHNPCLLCLKFVKNKLGILMYACVHSSLRSTSSGRRAGSSFIWPRLETKIRGSASGLFAIHLHFTRYIPQALLEGVKALLQARNDILASTLLTET